jgi:hypothetical protein
MLATTPLLASSIPFARRPFVDHLSSARRRATLHALATGHLQLSPPCRRLPRLQPRPS